MALVGFFPPPPSFPESHFISLIAFYVFICALFLYLRFVSLSALRFFHCVSFL